MAFRLELISKSAFGEASIYETSVRIPELMYETDDEFSKREVESSVFFFEL